MQVFIVVQHILDNEVCGEVGQANQMPRMMCSQHHGLSTNEHGDWPDVMQHNKESFLKTKQTPMSLRKEKARRAMMLSLKLHCHENAICACRAQASHDLVRFLTTLVTILLRARGMAHEAINVRPAT